MRAPAAPHPHRAARVFTGLLPGEPRRAARRALCGCGGSPPLAPHPLGNKNAPQRSRALQDDWRTGEVRVESGIYRYESDICASISAVGGARAALEGGGYELRWDDGRGTWKRAPEEVLCFTTREVFTGLVPQLEKDLKVDRKAAKKRMAEAEAIGDAGAYAFYNNIQNSIKVLMNSLYGGFGTARGGIFPSGTAIASAITATGRSWICTVKSNVEARAWVADGGRWGVCAGDVSADVRPAGARPVRVIYGDTGARAHARTHLRRRFCAGQPRPERGRVSPRRLRLLPPPGAHS